MIIYLDVLFVKEMLFNSIIIFLTGKITSQILNAKRIFLASLFGALYSIVIIFMNYKLVQNTLLNFICAMTIVKIAFNIKNIDALCKSALMFYLSTYLIAGLQLRVNTIESNLMFSLIALLFSLSVLIKQYKAKFRLESFEGTIFFNNQKEKLNFFIDTGNLLVTCYDEPIIVISNKHQLKIRADMKNARRVSYQTINEEKVFVDGVKVEKIILEYQNQIYENEAVLINANVNFEKYDAIVGLKFFETARKVYKNAKESEDGNFIINKIKS